MRGRIMVVEDERIIGAELQMRLEHEGYEVVANVGTEEAAVEAVSQVTPDLVLMDINLGRGGDGVSACGRIRERADVPVVFLSAYSDTSTIARAREKAPFGFLIKPVQDSALRAGIEVALGRHEVEARREHDLRRLTERQAHLDAAAAITEVCERCGRVRGAHGPWDDFAAHAERTGIGIVPKAVCSLCRGEAGKKT